MSKLNVLVVGASVAGPMTAYWFAKAGARVTVIERFPKLRDGGQGIDIRTSGVTIMRMIPGMEAAVRSKTTSQDVLEFVNGKGKPYATMKPSGNPNQQSLLSEYEIFRDDLSQILYDLTKDNKDVKYVWGEQIAAIEQKEGSDECTVDFLNGNLPRTTYDLVVACDGATSRTRALGLGCGLRDHTYPINMVAAYSTVEKDFLGGRKVGQMHSTVGGRAVGVGPDPAGGNRTCLLAVFPPGDAEALEPFRSAQKQGREAIKKYLSQHYAAGFSPRYEEMLKDTLASDSFYATEMMQVKLPSLYKGRFTLVGDAGYATGPTGGGTTLALTGGYILAGEICKHKGDVAAGLKAYEERMRPIIADMQQIPPGVPTFIAPQTRWGIWLRDAVVMAVTLGNGMFGWVLQYFASAFGGDKYNLPRYEWEN